jgi:hypothetical protein
MAREMVVHCFGFDSELALAGFCAPVILGTAIVFRFTPEGFQPSGFFRAVKSGKERPRPNFGCALGNLLDAPGNAQAVKFIVANGREDEQVQSALQKACLISFHSSRSY